MPKNYYIILGIPATSSHEEIKAAYRRLAKELHPDRCDEGHSPFQVIQEAYSVLSDPTRRRAYDDRRQHHKFTGPRGVNVEPMRARPRPEPLVPEQGPSGLTDVRLPRSFQTYRSSNETFFDRILSNFAEGGRTIATAAEPLFVVVTLTPDQAFRGGHIRINLPASLHCSDCQGHGGIGFYECWRCGGAGLISGDYPVMVSYPPSIPDGHVVRISLERFGMRDAPLNVRFRISDLI
ncbi:MAG: DnaJ domain-containing protein [Desulfofustis sp.]|nr:DnaJ domain-containing protein [Desulfofustis sp.]NNK57211.1 J domain-containing protein [Desulfofustis sp.]